MWQPPDFVAFCSKIKLGLDKLVATVAVSFLSCAICVAGAFKHMPNLPKPEEASASSQDRRRVHSRVNQIQRAEAAVHLAVDGLGHIDRLMVLNNVLSEYLRDAHESGALRKG